VEAVPMNMQGALKSIRKICRTSRVSMGWKFFHTMTSDRHETVLSRLYDVLAVKKGKT